MMKRSDQPALPKRRRVLAWCASVSIALGLLAAGGCASGGRHDEKAWNTYAEELEPQIGVAKIDAFVKRWGMPDQQIQLDDGIACGWRFSKGTRTVGFSYIVAVGSAHETYDEVTLIFNDDKVLQEWKVECIR